MPMAVDSEIHGCGTPSFPKTASQCFSFDVNTLRNYMAHSMEKHKKHTKGWIHLRVQPRPTNL